MNTLWTAVPLMHIRLTGGLLAERQRTILRRTIPQQYQQCLTTGRLHALDLKWTPEGKVPKPHVFWDSDIAKWIETAAYALTLKPDAELEAQVDDAIARMQRAQSPDGYLNCHFQVVDPSKRFSNLRDQHELYCAGHLMEAAVAYYDATGKRAMLDVMSRYADLIRRTFGPGGPLEGGYDGHEEIELALVKLARATHNPDHLDMARRFVEARGQQPHFFDLEAQRRGEDPRKLWSGGYDYYQSHVPVRRQTTVEGHSVRALYFLAGVADVAAATADTSLLSACRKAFDNCVSRRMYLTGGVGSTRHGERFTYDFDLPNESAYAETCASIALIFLAQRLLQIESDGRYADVIETALYNGVLSGMSLDGEKYFYANYLATDPRWHRFERGFPAERQGWFDCACCPPNLSRLLASIGTYAVSMGNAEVAVHLYTPLSAGLVVGDVAAKLDIATQYPWDGNISLRLKSASVLMLRLRVPGWCERFQLLLNGKRVRVKPVRGYVSIRRDWSAGDRVELRLDMPPRRVYTDVRVRHNTGRVALARGPVVYCLEETDNGPHLQSLSLPRSARIKAAHNSRLLGGVVTLKTRGLRDVQKSPKLYDSSPPSRKPTPLTAVPYYAWANRKPGEMTVFLRESLG